MSEFHIAGVKTNIHFLQGILRHPDFLANQINTRFVETHLDDLLDRAEEQDQRLYVENLSERETSTQSDTTIDPALKDSLTIRAPFTGIVVKIEVEAEVV